MPSERAEAVASVLLTPSATSGMGVKSSGSWCVYWDPSCTYNGVYGLHLAYLQSKACSERKSGAEWARPGFVSHDLLGDKYPQMLVKKQDQGDDVVLI